MHLTPCTQTSHKFARCSTSSPGGQTPMQKGVRHSPHVVVVACVAAHSGATRTPESPRTARRSRTTLLSTCYRCHAPSPYPENPTKPFRPSHDRRNKRTKTPRGEQRNTVTVANRGAGGSDSVKHTFPHSPHHLFAALFQCLQSIQNIFPNAMTYTRRG